MFARLIAILAILHGTVFLGAGNALEHLVHQMQAQEAQASDAHHGHHGHHRSHQESHAQHEMTQEDWLNCVFCLDGLMGTGIVVAWLDAEAPVQRPIHAGTSQLHSDGVLAAFLARAPPRIS